MNKSELQRKAEVAELLLHAARRLGEGIEPERVYERFHELIGGVLQHDGLIVSSHDERDDLIRCEYAWTDGAVLDPGTLTPVPLNREGGGMQSRVIVTGEPELFDVPQRVTSVDGVFYNVDAEGKLEKIPDAGPSKTTAAMMVPVKDEGRVVGVVQLMTDQGVYTEEELELFDGLVAQMGAAVRAARLQQERRRLQAAEGPAAGGGRQRGAGRPRARRSRRRDLPPRPLRRRPALEQRGGARYRPPRRGGRWAAPRRLRSGVGWARSADSGRGRRSYGAVGDASVRAWQQGRVAVIRRGPHLRRPRLRVPRRHGRVAPGGGEERLRRDDFA